MGKLKKLLTYLVIVGLSAICALSYHLFVFPNNFAPSGLNGICTMIQYLSGISIGYLSLLLNIPLAFLVFRKVSRSLAIRAMVYVAGFSVFVVLLEYVDLSTFAYATENGTSSILGPLVAGIIQGACSSILIRASSYSGGMDFVASLIRKARPEVNFFWVVFALNVGVALLSFFVYDYRMEPVLLCILYSFTSSSVTDRLTKSGREAVRFEIITDQPDALAQIIIRQLRHSATVIPAKGVYRGNDTNVLICVVNKTQAATLSAIVQSYPNAFAVMSHVSSVMGNFKRLNSEGRPETDFLDHGDGGQET